MWCRSTALVVLLLATTNGVVAAAVTPATSHIIDAATTTATSATAAASTTTSTTPATTTTTAAAAAAATTVSSPTAVSSTQPAIKHENASRLRTAPTASSKLQGNRTAAEGSSPATSEDSIASSSPVSLPARLDYTQALGASGITMVSGTTGTSTRNRTPSSTAMLRLQTSIASDNTSSSTTFFTNSQNSSKMRMPISSATPRQPGSLTSLAEESTTAGLRSTSRAALSEWEEFKKKHSKAYLTRDDLKRTMSRGRAMGLNMTLDQHADEDRMNMYLSRKQAIEEHNLHVKSFKRALNTFADMTPQEVLTKHTGLILAGRKPRGSTFDYRSLGRLYVPLPRRFDWREKGALTEPRNQATCGCCWAFAATAVLEAKNFIRTRRLVSLSEQNLLDCDTLDDKCDGGTPWDAFDWVQNNGGQEENERYPYEVLPDRCRQDKNRLYKMQIKGYMSVRPSTEDNIMAALVAEGPMTVAVNAILPSFQDYREGVYSDPECSGGDEELHHAMVLVGYGDDPTDGPFWTLRNSWGRDWGESGYIRVSRQNNLCGVSTYAVFPTLE